MRVVKTYYFERLEPGEKKPRRSAYPMTIDEASRLFKGGVPIMATEKVTEILEAGDPDFPPNYGPSQHSRYAAGS